MVRISQDRRFERVEHIEVSVPSVLHFGVECDSTRYTWDGVEDAEWTIDDVDYVENGDEDYFFLYPEEDYFVCEIEATREEGNLGPVHCWCE